MNKPILVTGGAGYIGSHICKLLAGRGYDPIAFDNLSKGHRKAVQWGPLEVGDLLDRTSVDRVLQTYRPLAVMHFAASIEVGESVRSPEKYYQNNVGGSLSLLCAMLDAGVGHIVFSSTAATYGNPLAEKIDETHPQQPINPYGMSKLMIETIMNDIGRAHGLRSVFLRYFNAAGADAAGDIGELHDPETHLIPIIMQTATGDKDKLSIFGDDYDTPDGTCLRDYIHVEDLAEAHLLALEHLLAGEDSSAFNLGTGNGNSVREIHHLAEQVVGHSIPVEICERRPGDPAILVADPTRAETVLGWKRTHTLSDILVSAWNWHCAQKNAPWS